MKVIFRRILRDSDQDNRIKWPVLDDGIGRTFPSPVDCYYCDNEGWVRYKTGEEDECPRCGGSAGMLTWCVFRRSYRTKLNRPLTGRRDAA